MKVASGEKYEKYRLGSWLPNAATISPAALETNSWLFIGVSVLSSKALHSFQSLGFQLSGPSS
jgi:hypothetical protein